MSTQKINIALIGLGFGAEFIPIYQKHPNANLVALCQRNEAKLNQLADTFHIKKRYTSYEELLSDSEIDAVHINTPIPDHGRQSILALKAGKHVACTVPMATTIEECEEIVRLTEESGLTYMMMETVVYAREFLYMKELYENGDLGKVQFLKASHQQDMDGWPNYWPGLPPMHYATHCVGPVLALTRGEAEYVSCFGSGTIREELIPHYNSPFAVETTHIKFRNSDLSAQVYRSLFDVARQYRESFEVYGSKKSVEWPLIEGKPLVVHTAKKPEPEIPEEIQSPDFAKLLPKEIQHFTTQGVYDSEEHQHLSFTQGAGHGGSHPHLVHEFINALTEWKSPYPNARQSANITCVGILAHESALKGGELMKLPNFTFEE
ncbi:Gfo/Idh/MocA family oxidoreductase [Zobellia sp. 1_MG-2023]|uniref:Gfo/Idh/MocA family oxidoreductase n=1 Tax=Zobellia sp. 1_MG-2023 TaxID=3062626 RepID=UPI0026E3B975|nr:Gfo/Idh/MocA family oxidoreductase [Zobellia sp. 1_MG-2023]MDO6819548.1 Gfo/Idh/MocA family oxidoreductase [Zobellia sp. 1_MG-2023]